MKRNITDEKYVKRIAGPNRRYHRVNPGHLLHDNGSVLSKEFQNSLKGYGIESIGTAQEARGRIHMLNV